MPFQGKCFCLITGASSGFGQAIAQLIVRQRGPLHNASSGSQIALVSRNIDGMEETKSLMAQDGFDMERFSIDILPIDLTDTEITETKFKTFIKMLPQDFENVMVFNNAGSVGNISKKPLEYQWSITEYQKYFNLNQICPVFIINSICKHLSDSKCIVVQTSSLCAVESMPHMSMYCTAKVSMDMFLKCLTLDHPEIITLNYAPGPLDTKMGLNMKENNGSEEVRSRFKTLFDQGTIIVPTDSASKLMNLIAKMDFESGAHIDYYDI